MCYFVSPHVADILTLGVLNQKKTILCSLSSGLVTYYLVFCQTK